LAFCEQRTSSEQATYGFVTNDPIQMSDALRIPS
jgi:hypothetical protein